MVAELRVSGRRARRMLAAAALAVGVASAWGLERIQPGMAEEDVLERLGKPSGKIAMGERSILHYGSGQVELVEGEVVSVTIRSRREAVEAPGDPAAEIGGRSRQPPRDMPTILARLREGRGVACAEALLACDGEWAAPAITSIVPLLGISEEFEMFHSRHVAGRPSGPMVPVKTDMGALAADALAQIGAAAREPCLHALRTGRPLARANAAEALLRMERRGGHEPGAEFSGLALKVFGSGAMSGADAVRARMRMARTVAKLPGEEATAALLEALGSPHRAVVLECVRLLGERNDPAAFSALVDLFLNGADERVRNEAGLALERAAPKTAARAARAGVRHADRAVREQTMRLMWKAADPELAGDYRVLMGDADASIRRRALQGATHYPGAETAVRLARALQEDPDRDVARDAGGSLVQVAAGVRDPQVVDPLLRGVRHPDPERRALFAEALGRTRAPAAFDALASAALHDAAPAVRAVALRVLDGFDSDRRRGVYLQSLKRDPSPEVRQVAMQVVRHGSLAAEQRAILLDLVRTGDRARALEAALAMGELRIVGGDPDVVETLIQALSHEDRELRAKAEAHLFAAAGIDRFSSQGRAFDRTPGAWREWWRAQRP